MNDKSTVVQFPGTKRIEFDLFIVHPALQADSISLKLDLEPQFSHSIGELRRTPQGTRLSGKYKDTRWRYSRQHRLSSQHFLPLLENFIDSLSRHGKFFEELRATGGSAMVTVKFLGDGHYGDSISREVLAKLVTLNLDLGVESYSDRQS